MVAAALRAFLDANVLFSAAYLETSGIRRLWAIPGVQLVTSNYAVEEAIRNLTTARQRTEIRGLLSSVEVVAASASPTPLFLSGSGLPEKDQPILLAAVESGCDYLITGDKAHFGHLYDTVIEGVTVIRAASFLQFCRDRVEDQL